MSEEKAIKPIKTVVIEVFKGDGKADLVEKKAALLSAVKTIDTLLATIDKRERNKNAKAVLSLMKKNGLSIDDIVMASAENQKPEPATPGAK